MSQHRQRFYVGAQASTMCGIPEELAMEEISAAQSVATDRSAASVGDLSVSISKTRDEFVIGRSLWSMIYWPMMSYNCR
jgi:hypothetical protein